MPRRIWLLTSFYRFLQPTGATAEKISAVGSDGHLQDPVPFIAQA